MRVKSGKTRGTRTKGWRERRKRKGTWEEGNVVEFDMSGRGRSEEQGHVLISHTGTDLLRSRTQATAQIYGCVESVCSFPRLVRLPALHWDEAEYT